MALQRTSTVPSKGEHSTFKGTIQSIRASLTGFVSFAHAGAAGVMIEDQTWPKRM